MPTFLELPQELLLRVSTNLTTPDLGVLRRTCKHVDSYLFDSFAREFFTKRQFMIEHISLQALVDISKHPVLSTYLREVIITTHKFHTRFSTGPSHAICDENKFAIREVLLQTGLARELLTEAFSSLKNLRTIGLRDYNARGRYRDGEKATWNSYGWSLSGFSGVGESVVSDTGGETLLMLLYALGKSDCSSVEGVEVFLRHVRLKPKCFSLNSPLTQSVVAPIWARLKTLMLTLEYDDHFDNGHKSIPPFRRIMRQTTQLETLRLNFDGGGPLHWPLLDWLGGSALSSPGDSSLTSDHTPPSLSNLTKLDLGSVSLKPEQLLGLVLKFRLTSLSLWKLSLEQSTDEDEEEPVWANFLLSLSQELPIDNPYTALLIGFVTEAYVREVSRSVHHNAVHFLWPRDRKHDTPDEALRQVKFRGGPDVQLNVKDWLQDLAPCVRVPSRLERVRHIDDDEDDDDDSEELEFSDEHEFTDEEDEADDT